MKARHAWNLLPRFFPDALSAILMPNHLHLIVRARTDKPSHPFIESTSSRLIEPRFELTDTRFVETSRERSLNSLGAQSDENVHEKLRIIMGAISKKQNVKALWQPIEPPRFIADRRKLARDIRYVALNPCRAKICADPLEWVWSTYRDVVGAAANPWVPPSRIVRELGESERGFQIRFHAYVSGDPSVAVAGTPFPKPALIHTLTQEGIGEILAASASAARLPVADVQKRSELRRIFVHLAHRQGWGQPARLAQICDATPRAIHYILSQKPPSSVEAAALCLGDRRLRKSEFLK